jgi:capsular polysaccharide biosynthesis protein
MLDSPRPSAYEMPDALDHAPETIQGVFEPPSGLVLSAISRHKAIVVFCAVALALLGAGIGKTRTGTYTASATLQVGQVNPNSPGFYGYVQSATSLATAFSHAVTAEPVLGAVQDKLKLAPSKAVARLSAEPLPLAPAFRVIATGPTEYAAMQLANVTARAVIDYESQTNSSNPQAASLLSEYRGASIQLHRAMARLESLGQSHRTPENVLLRAQAEKDSAEITSRALEVAYTAAVTSEAPRNGLVTLLADATSASSNRGSKITILGFIGLLAGMVIGCLAAVLLERRRVDGKLERPNRV